MLLDLASTIIGALIATFTIALLASIWALTAPKEKEEEDVSTCPFLFDLNNCERDCEYWHKCYADYRA